MRERNKTLVKFVSSSFFGRYLIIFHLELTSSLPHVQNDLKETFWISNEDQGRVDGEEQKECSLFTYCVLIPQGGTGCLPPWGLS